MHCLSFIIVHYKNKLFGFYILGECISRYTSKKIPFCIKFHPEEDKQHLFVAGTSDKKILCVCIQPLLHLLSAYWSHLIFTDYCIIYDFILKNKYKKTQRF